MLLVLTQRPERDHRLVGAARARGAASSRTGCARSSSSRSSGDAERELLARARRRGRRSRPSSSGALLAQAEGNPFFLEELVRSLADVGALARTDDGWRFDHDVAIEVPPTVEKVILARVDRLDRPSAATR